MEFESSTARLLFQISFVAVNTGQASAGLEIAEAVAAIRPKSELPQIVAMLALAGMGKMEEAVDRGVKKALPLDPESIVTQFFLGIVYFQKGGHVEEVRKFLTPISSSCPDEGMQEAAENIIKQLDQTK